MGLELPWESSGWDSALIMQGAQIQPLIGELRCHTVRQKKKNLDLSPNLGFSWV